MIEISSKGSLVTATLTGTYPVGGWTFTFNWNASNESYALLLANNLSGHLEESLRKIRQQAYHDGYRAAKAKAKRCSWFSGLWTS